MESQMYYEASEAFGPPEVALAPKKRFQIEKIEERIVPASPNMKSKNCGGGGGGGGGCTQGLGTSYTFTVPGPY